MVSPDKWCGGADVNRCIVLAALPSGMPKPADFRLVDQPVPQPSDGQVLIRHTWLGLAPVARVRMSATASYRAPMALGEVVHGQAVGVVCASRASGFAKGDIVMCMAGGWQEHSIASASTLVRVEPDLAPDSVWLGALGTSGMTAYVGLLDIGQPVAGETVVVSAASGGVGAVVGQIARLKGCRVVGVAGGPAKIRHLVDTLGFDAAVDHRQPDFAQRLAVVCPQGIDVYFDNVGGAVRDGVWPLMAKFGRVVVCGLVSEYNDRAERGPDWMAILNQRLRIRGFILSDHLHRRSEFLRDMAAWYRNGKVLVHEDISHGLESVVPAFIDMLQGRNFGKTVIRLG